MNRRVRRIIACAAAAASMMSFSLTPVSAPWNTAQLPVMTACAADPRYGDYSYRGNETGITISKYNGSDTVVTVPDEINGKPVTAIGSNAFSSKSKITSVTIPKTVTVIESEAFGDCKSLTSFTFHEGIEKIQFGAFDNVPLTEITLPSTLTVCNNGFRTSTLKKATFAKGTETVPEDCFYDATGLETVIMPDTVKTIGTYAFRNCRSLSSFTFHEGLEEIHFGAFDDVPLTEITLPSTLTVCNNGFRTSTLKKATLTKGAELVPESCFYDATGLETVILPDTVKNIGNYAFRNCRSLSSFTFHEGLEEIHFGAFDNTALTGITLPSTLTACGNAFRTKSLKKVTFAEGTELIPDSCLYDATGLETVILPDTVKTIGSFAFKNCRSLSDFTFHEGIEKIEYGAFDNTALAKITLPSTLTDSSNAFRTKTLKQVTFAEGTVTIPEFCLDDAKGVETVILPDSVKTIGYGAFKNCISLAEFTFPEGLETINTNAFSNTAITEITLPSTLKSCQSGFEGCKTLRKVIFADGTAKIPYGCLSNVYSLEEVVLPESLKTIDTYAFRNTCSLKSIELPEGLETINSSAFIRSGLRSIVIPDSVTDIGLSAFESCESLRSAVLGKGVTLLNTIVFRNDTALEEVTLPDTVKTVCEYSFSNCRSLSKVNYTGEDADIKCDAFYHCYSLKDERFVHLSRPESEIRADVKSAAVGGKVNFTVSFDALDDFADASGNFTLLLTVPSSFGMDEASVEAVLGTVEENKPFSNGEKEIVFTTGSGEVNFSLTAKEAGEFDIDSDLVLKSADGKTWTEPIGSVRVSVKELVLNVPAAVNTKQFTISGMGPVNTPVDILMDGRLIDSPVTDPATGRFFVTVVLPEETKEGDTFTFYAGYNGVKTEEYTVVYSEAEPAVRSVKLRVNEWEGDADVTDAFAECASPVKLLLPDRTVKFTLDISNSELISKVFITNNSITSKSVSTQLIETRYDEENDVWTATRQLDVPAGDPGGINIIIVTKADAAAGEEIDYTRGFFSYPAKIVFLKKGNGTVYEAAPSNPIGGAEITIYSIDDDGREMPWDPEDTYQKNPMISDETGHFAWIAPVGDWRIVCNAEGFEQIDSGKITVRDENPVIEFGLSSDAPGEVSDIWYDQEESGCIRICFGKYMQPDSVNDNTVTVEGFPGYTIEPVFHGTDEEVTDTFVLVGDYSELVDVTVKVGTGCLSYAGTENTESMEKTIHINDPAVTELPEETTAATAPAETVSTVTTAVPVTTETKPAATTEEAPATTTAEPAETTADAVTTETSADIAPETATTSPSDPPKDLRKGDINGDGMVDAVDASCLLDEYANLSTGGEPSVPLEVSDVNGDGRVTSSDASLLLAFYAYNSAGYDIGLEEFLRSNI